MGLGIKCLLDSQAQLVSDALLEAQPMQRRRDVVSARALEDKSRGRVENALQHIDLFLRDSCK